MSLTLIKKLKNDELKGFGIIGSLRKHNKEDNKYYLDIDKLGTSLTLLIDSTNFYTEFTSRISTGELIEGETFISYTATVPVVAEAKHITKGDNAYNFVGNKLGVPVLQSFEIIEE